MKLEPGKLNLGLGGQIGSEGKGLQAHYVSVCNHIDLSITSNAANAGHTFWLDGEKCIAKFLPVSGIVHTRNHIYLCSGAIIDPKGLLKELDRFDIDHDRVAIHPNCAIITEEDITLEKVVSSSVTKIGSTQSGVGSALVRKISRSAKLAKDIPELSHMIHKLNIHELLDIGCTAYMEVPQGLDLSLNGPFYPHCTSRDITVSAALSDAQVHPSYLGKVCVCLRTYPIRVGNILEAGIKVGNSGPFYNDSVELSWEDVGVKAELTTVTGRVRRVASFSMKQYKNMLDTLRPDYVLLNFANYLSRAKLAEMLEELPEVSHLGFGPTVDKVFLNHGSFKGD